MPEILLCGSEGEQFIFQNTLDITKGSDDKRRGAVKLETGDQMYRQFSQGYADFWVHARLAFYSDYASSASGDVLIVSAGDTALVTIKAAQNNYYAGVELVAGDVTAAFPIQASEFNTYDIRISVGAADTTVYFYRDEVLRKQVTLASVALPDTILIQSQSTSVADSPVWVQDIVIADGLPTVGMELATLVPSAVGHYSDFTNDYSAIDEAGYSADDVITTVTPNARESWFFSDPDFNLGDKVIYAVAMTTVAQTDLTNQINDFVPFLRIGANDYSSDTLGVNNIAPKAVTRFWLNNPATNTPWEKADLTGLEAGLQAV